MGRGARRAILLAFACAPPPSPDTRFAGTLAARAEVPPSVTAQRDGGDWHATFTWRGPGDDVRLTSEASGWSAEGIPLIRGADGWSVQVTLRPGVHHYKFIVDGTWQADPANPVREPDGFDGWNSVIRLGPDGMLDRANAARGDAVVESDAITLARFGDALRVSTLRGDVTAVEARPAHKPPVPLLLLGTGRDRDHWGTALGVDPGESYTLWFSDGGAPAPWPGALPAEQPDDAPAWARDAVWYQVFPDRFRNGDRTNDPPGTVAWTHASEASTPDEPLFPAIWMRHFGGDFAGIEAGLGHIASLGVDAIYLNPVWAAPSPHRYDATSWLHVDPELGVGEPLATADALSASDERFVALVAAVHARGLRVVVDGVFNHVGSTHAAAVDVARRGRKSAFANWFETGPDGALVGWHGFASLPALAKTEIGYRDPAVEDHIFSVTQRWMDPNGDGDPSDGVDGWRLDVADEVPAPFWARWRAEVARINPDAVIIGEVWKEIPRWSRVFHGVTDYRFATAVLQFAESGDAPSLVARLADQRAAVSPTAGAVSWNLVDSHDTDRLLSRVFNSGRPFDQRNRTQDEASTFRGGRPDAAAFERARLVAFLQATLPGAPLIWQGDEVGVWGADDPHNRRPMPWPDQGTPAPGEPTWDTEHLDWYRRVFSLRRDHPSLRASPVETLVATGGLWVYRRGDTVSAVNASDLTVALPAIAGERMIGGDDRVLAPRSAAFWVTRSSSP